MVHKKTFFSINNIIFYAIIDLTKIQMVQLLVSISNGTMFANYIFYSLTPYKPVLKPVEINQKINF